MGQAWDYIIVGGGAAGCVLPNQLSADPRRRVLLLEAGGENRSLFVSMPKGFGRRLSDPKAEPGGGDDDEAILAMVRSKGIVGLHAMGACAMGEVEASVVDQRLRVRGVRGLRVADCSVMAGLVAGNTNGPALALGWRAADLMLEDAERVQSGREAGQRPLQRERADSRPLEAL